MSAKKPESPSVVIAFWPLKPSQYEYSPLTRVIRHEDGETRRVMLEPGQPMLLNGDELAACQRDIDAGTVKTLQISLAHALQILEQFADVERDRQIRQLRATVGRLTNVLRSTGMFRTAEIDEFVTDEVNEPVTA